VKGRENLKKDVKGRENLTRTWADVRIKKTNMKGRENSNQGRGMRGRENLKNGRARTREFKKECERT